MLLTVQVDSVGLRDKVIPPNVAAAVNFFQHDLLTVRGEREIRAEDPARTRILGNFQATYLFRRVKGDDPSWFRHKLGGSHAKMELDPATWDLVRAVHQRCDFEEIKPWSSMRCYALLSRAHSALKPRRSKCRLLAKWIDTGIDFLPNDTLKITATGKLQYTNARQACGPEGLSRGWTDLIRQLPVNEAGRGALVGRIGANAAARAF